MASFWRMTAASAEAADVTARLQEHGLCIVEGLGDAATMSALGAELAPLFEAIPMEENGGPMEENGPMSGNGAAPRNRTRRVHSRLLASSPAYGALVLHSLVRAVCGEILGPHCVRDQLSSVQGIEVWPGAGAQELHRDDAIFRMPRPRPEMELNAMWAVDGFTAENGATRIIPGSHRWEDGRKPGPADEVVAAEMPAGSVLIWLGSTWHGAGANGSRRPRRGAYVGYSLGWLRQEETLYLALPPAVARELPEPLQRLIGYELKGTMTLGWLDGGDPRRVLEEGR
jgi:ectoine hydroxylase-related dioxygenase (phytanoyl-CoA dioxygenase family)